MVGDQEGHSTEIEARLRRRIYIIIVLHFSCYSHCSNTSAT